MGFLPWEIQVAFPRKSQLQKSLCPTYGACWLFWCFHNPPNSDMDCRIFNVCTDVTACIAHRGCTDTEREPALNTDSGRKNPCHMRPHEGIEFGLAACQSDALPTELMPCSTYVKYMTDMMHTFYLCLLPPLKEFTSCWLGAWSLSR